MTVRNVFLAWLLCTGFAVSAAAQEPTVLTLVREHVGDDCVVGPVTSERATLAWAVEKPWKGNKAVWGGLAPGTYPARATYRAGTGAGSGIELAFNDLPDQPASVLVLGAHTANGAGRVAIGPELAGNCRVKSGKRYPAAAGRLARRVFGTVKPENGQSTELRVRVDDR